MTENKNISLQICGRPTSGGGFVPFVMYGNPNFTISDNNIGYIGLGNNPYIFAIRIMSDQIVYQIVINDVKTIMDNGQVRNGRVSIGMSIPNGYRLTGGISPYDVLEKLRDAFITRCLSIYDNNKSVYAFRRDLGDIRHVVDDIADTIKIETHKGPHRPMIGINNIGVVTATEQQIRMLLNDVQYSAFTEYSEIIIAQDVRPDCNYSRINIEIPRQSQYELIEDGVRTRTINGDFEPITCNGKMDPRYYYNRDITFTVAELKSGKVINGVSIDTVNEVINVNLHVLSTQRTQTIYVEANPKAASKNISNDFAVYYDGINLPLAQDGSFTLTGINLAYLERRERFMVRYNGAKYSVSRWDISENNGKLHMYISLVENKGGSSGGHVSGTMGVGSVNGAPVQSANFTEFSVIIPDEYAKAAVGGVIEADCRIYNSSTYSDGDRPKQSVFANVQRGRNREYEFSIAIDRKLLRGGVYLEVTIGNKVIKSGKITDRSHTTIDNFDEKRGSKKKSSGSKFMKLILILLLGIVGAATGAIVTYLTMPKAETFNCPEGCKDNTGKQLKFSNEQDLINHYIDEHHKPQYPCEKCPELYDNLSDLNKHIITEEKRCPICKEALTKVSSGGVDSYSCKSCSITYIEKQIQSSRDNTYGHRPTPKPNPEPTPEKFKCMCGKEYSTKAERNKCARNGHK